MTFGSTWGSGAPAARWTVFQLAAILQYCRKSNQAPFARYTLFCPAIVSIFSFNQTLYYAARLCGVWGCLTLSTEYDMTTPGEHIVVFVLKCILRCYTQKMQGFKNEEENGKLKSDRLCGIWVCFWVQTLRASPLQVREYRHDFRKLKMGDKIAHITLCDMYQVWPQLCVVSLWTGPISIVCD